MRTRFTLVELMIVVAIIGILAAIAVPNFVQMQYRSKFAEMPLNVDGIMQAQRGYDAAYDTFVDSSSDIPTFNPRAALALDKVAVPWLTGTSFKTLEWAPDGNVRCGYLTEDISFGAPEFFTEGICDIDNDDNWGWIDEDSIWGPTQSGVGTY